VISFLDFYAKTRRNTKGLQLLPISEEDMQALGRALAAVAQAQQSPGLHLLRGGGSQPVGVAHGKCIDDGLIEGIVGRPIPAKKDKGQRVGCGCVESVDLGAYNTCLHQCLYWLCQRGSPGCGCQLG